MNFYLQKLFKAKLSFNIPCRFQAVLKFFKYKPKKSAELDPKDFFALWSGFAVDFKDVWNREQQRIHKEK